jgi:CubicO group peptidase (beta-lactamase class C family)
MTFKIATLFALSLALVLPSFAHAQQSSTQDSIDVFLKNQMERRHIPALQVAIARDGKIIKNATYGVANLEHRIPATNESIFSINSITKAFVGVAVMQLAEEGKLKITDPLSVYLDSLPATWQQITLQQVLTHSSGLPDMLDADEQVMGHGDEATALGMVSKLPMEFKAGEKFRYNQTGYVLLGKIITKLGGMHFTKFIEEKQFAVAGMKLTRFGDSYDVIPNYAGQYTMTRQVGDSFVRSKTPGIGYMQFPVFFRTAAGIQSTATDMANWIIALKGGKLLKEKASLETLWTPGTLNNGKIGGFSQYLNGYALGWPTVSRAEHPAVAPVGGGRSALFVYRKDDLSIVLLTNLMGANPEKLIDELAGYYIPEMHEANGFGLPANVKILRAELLKQGFKNPTQVVSSLKKSNPSFNLGENDLNAWGYQLLSEKKPDEALSIFKLNVSLYRQSANAYDSLAETLELMGNKKDALLNYKKSLALNPDNKSATGRITALSIK